MELAMYYSQMTVVRHEERTQARRIDYTDRLINSQWQSFHQSDERTISIIGGRRTGKTYNLMLRALRSTRDCIIFCNERSVRYMSNIFRDIAHDLVDRFMTFERSSRIVLMDGRTITVSPAPKSQTAMMALNLRGMDVLIDEFDNDDFSRLVEIYGHKLEEAATVICAGSMYNLNPNYAKRWFASSDHYAFIDSPNVPTTRGHMPYEYTPSSFRSFFNQLPSLDAILT